MDLIQSSGEAGEGAIARFPWLCLDEQSYTYCPACLLVSHGRPTCHLKLHQTKPGSRETHLPGAYGVDSRLPATACFNVQAGIERLPNLRILLMSNNRVKDWSEVDRLGANSKLEELLLMGNPLIPVPGTPEYRTEASLPQLRTFLYTWPVPT